MNPADHLVMAFRASDKAQLQEIISLLAAAEDVDPAESAGIEDVRPRRPGVDRVRQLEIVENTGSTVIIASSGSGYSTPHTTTPEPASITGMVWCERCYQSSYTTYADPDGCLCPACENWLAKPSVSHGPTEIKVINTTFEVVD